MTAPTTPEVDGSTQVYAVLGHPVRHTLSPRIQNTAFRAAAMNAVYVALDVPPKHLQEALRGLHAARISGLSVTAPHKEAVFSLACGHTLEAQEARAVNTLRWVEGGWLGHATDGMGFSSWMIEAGIDVAQRRVILIGAGGVARCILPKLRALGPAEVLVVSRTAERAAALVQSSSGGATAGVSSAAMRDEAASGLLGGWDLLIRAIPAESITGDEDRWWRLLAPRAPVLDLNYGDRAAPVRSRALAEGRRHEDGRALLVHQGAASFEFWTGSAAPMEAMMGALRGV